MDLRHTQIKENHPRNIFFLVDAESDTQSPSDKDESREKNKQNQCALGEKVGTTGSNHFFFSNFVSDVTLKKPFRVQFLESHFKFWCSH